ncbi:extracellular solute-binding protein [Streptomyces sp. NPDC008313]|uniref:extracellular solute-binding protein n=1 Tax=Streptomyces sp. NPDC008313 TaxID=3364826 RepID=UPI0036E3D672
MRPPHRPSGRPPGRPRRLAAVLASLLLAACACTADGGADGDPGGGTHAVTGEIVVASGRDVTGEGGVREQLIDAWNERQEKRDSGVRARLVELPGSADLQRSQLLGALQSGSARYDVVNLDVTWVPEFADAGLIRKLPDDMVDDDVVASVAETARWDGQVYAVPFNSDVGLLYYRRDYLAAAGVNDTDLPAGTSWRKVQQLSSTLDDAGEDRPKAYEKGWTTQLDAYEGRTVNAVESFASATGGARLTDGRGRYTGSVETLERGIGELRDRTQTPYTLPAAFHSGEDRSLTDFADGRTAFLRHWPYAYRTLHQSLDDRRLGVAPLPGRAVLGGQNLAVTRASGQREAAEDLIRFLTGAGSERCLLDAGFAATRTSAYTDDGLRCEAAGTRGASPASPSASASGESADRMPRDAQGRPEYARGVLLPALRRAVQRPRTPLYGAFTQTFSTTLGALFTDDPPSDARLARRLDEALHDVLED